MYELILTSNLMGFLTEFYLASALIALAAGSLLPHGAISLLCWNNL